MCTSCLRSLASAVTLAVAALSAATSQAGAIGVGYSGHTGDRLTAVMAVTDLDLFEAGDFTLSYDPGLLSLQSVVVGSLTGSFTLLAGPTVPQGSGNLADVIVSLITGGGPVAGDGTLFKAAFTLTSDTATVPAELGLSFDELGFGYSLGNASLSVTLDAMSPVPELTSVALFMAGLLALGTVAGVGRARANRRV